MTKAESVLIKRHNGKARIIGILFLLATITFSIGSNLADSFFLNKALGMPQLIGGVILQLVDAVACAFIGILAFSIFGGVTKKLSLGYAILRIVEFLVILGAGIYMLVRVEKFPMYAPSLCIFTGLGGAIFSFTLYNSQAVPSILAILGCIGYVLLTIGSILHFMGIVDIYIGPGMLFLAPGGLFELFLPIWLLIKGLKPTFSASESIQSA